MRQLPPNFPAETNKQVTTPVYLIELQFYNETKDSYEIIRVSSRQQVDVDGVVFTETNPHILVKNLSSDKVTLEVNNPTSLMLYYTFNSKSNAGLNIVNIFLFYGEDTVVTIDDIALFFSGKIDEIPTISKTKIIYNCIAGALPIMWTPRIRIGPPMCNHIPKDGTMIGNITLERK
jgi:hypothetical protein